MGFEIEIETNAPITLELENPLGHQPNKTLMNKMRQYIENLIAEQAYQDPIMSKKGQSNHLQNVAYSEYYSRVDKFLH